MLIFLIGLIGCGPEAPSRGGSTVTLPVSADQLLASVERVVTSAAGVAGESTLPTESETDTTSRRVRWANYDVEVMVRPAAAASELQTLVAGPWHVGDDIILRVHNDLVAQGLMTGTTDELIELRTFLKRYGSDFPLVEELRRLRED